MWKYVNLLFELKAITSTYIQTHKLPNQENWMFEKKMKIELKPCFISIFQFSIFSKFHIFKNSSFHVVHARMCFNCLHSVPGGIISRQGYRHYLTTWETTWPKPWRVWSPNPRTVFCLVWELSTCTLCKGAWCRAGARDSTTNLWRGQGKIHHVCSWDHP